MFQSTLPRRERQLVLIEQLILSSFNPRSREGSDKNSRVSSTTALVSIHAPAKGATNFCDCKRAGWQVSIHAPAKGATVWSIIIRSYRIMFQSTLPRRERLKLISREWKRWQFQSTLPRRERHDKLIQVNILTNVSIHAPAKGATIRRYQKERVKKFQSTLPRRERRRRRKRQGK